MSKDVVDRADRVAAREDLNAGQVGMCPYFLRDRGGGKVYCECARFRFPDKEARRDIVYRFCAHPEGYHACPLKQAMDGYYARRYSSEEAAESARRDAMGSRVGAGGGS